MKTVCGYLDLLFGWSIQYFNRIDTQGTINVFRIDDRSIALDMKGKYNLRGIKIETKDNRILRFGKWINAMIPTLRYAENPEVMLTFIKKDSHQAVYVFSFEEKLINHISKQLRLPPMSGNEITSAILDSMLAQKFTIKDNRHVKTGFSAQPFIPYGLEMTSGKFRAKAQIAIDNIVREYSIFQGVEYENNPSFSPIDLFRSEWEGSVNLWFNFSAIAAESRVKVYDSVARYGDKEFSKECAAINNKEDDDMVREIKENTYIVNSIAILKDETNIKTISEELKIVFEKNYLTGPKIVSKTLMLTRDSDFDALLPKDAILKYFASSHKMQTPDRYVCDFHGDDISGNIVDYSFKNNDNPHTILSGKTGSGKSVQSIGILEGILGYSHVHKKATNIKKVNLRYCDVGYTSGRFIADLKAAHPEDVEIFGSRVSGLRFGLFEFDSKPGEKISEENLDFFVAFVSFALETDSVQPLEGLERAFLSNIVSNIYEKKAYSDLYVEDLKKDIAYQRIIERIEAAGFSLSNKISELPNEFDFMKRPTMQDVVGAISVEIHNPDNSETDIKIYESLLMKMKVLAANPMINRYSNVELLGDKAIFHIDFNEIKENVKAFNISYWMIMKKWIKHLKAKAAPSFARNETPDPTYFFIEEAHNFFKYASFTDMLTTAVKELRKFEGRFFFITQDIFDLPEKVYQELSTKIFVVSASDKERYKVIAQKVYPQEDMSQINEVIDYLDDRMLLVLGDHGVIGCKLHLGAPIEYYRPYIL